MAKAGQRGSRGMRQPTRGGDQLIQVGPLIALEQFDHARDLSALARRGAVVALWAAVTFAPVVASDAPSFVFGTPVLGMDCALHSSPGSETGAFGSQEENDSGLL